VVPSSRDELDVGGRGSRSVRPVVFGSGRPFFAAGGVAEPLRLENPTTLVPGDRVTHLVYDVCTG
jgi:hypothetical protein